MPSLPTFPTDRLHIRPWIDPVIDRLGHVARSSYVETYLAGDPRTQRLLAAPPTG